MSDWNGPNERVVVKNDGCSSERIRSGRRRQKRAWKDSSNRAGVRDTVHFFSALAG